MRVPPEAKARGGRQGVRDTSKMREMHHQGKRNVAVFPNDSGY
jgi:hypothetical protein